MVASGFHDNPPPWRWPRAAYVHIPFCAHQCGYCDFAVAVGRDDQIGGYLNALERELERMETPQRVTTLFLGGGTPSYLPLPYLDRLLSLLREWFVLEPGHEFSIEANPDDFRDDRVVLLADFGVNRVSLGVQSFHADTLRVLERRHQPREVPAAFEKIKRVIPNVSVDLIFGVPGQTLDDWKRDLLRAVELEPTHLSTYGLTFEKGTPLWKQWKGGEVHPLDEDDELAMYLAAMDTLSLHGFDHYEISNFARPGWRSRHNQVYWANHAYFGAGMGAARYVQGVRETNTRELAGYLAKASAGENAAFQSECLDDHDRAMETIALQIRRAEGLERGPFQLQTGITLETLVGQALQRLVAWEMLTDDDQGVRLTRQGRCVADAVIKELMTGR